MKFQVNLKTLQYDVITMLFYEVITKSQILSNKIIKKNPVNFAI